MDWFCCWLQRKILCLNITAAGVDQFALSIAGAAGEETPGGWLVLSIAAVGGETSDGRAISWLSIAAATGGET